MTINLSIPVSIFNRLVTAVEQLAADYRRIHPLPVESKDEEVKFWVQSDRKLFEAEQARKETASGAS
jgi:hypothetical protein